MVTGPADLQTPFRAQTVVLTKPRFGFNFRGSKLPENAANFPSHARLSDTSSGASSSSVAAAAAACGRPNSPGAACSSRCTGKIASQSVTLFKMRLPPLRFVTDLLKNSNSVMSNAEGAQATANYGEDVSVGKVGGVFKKILKEGTGSKNPQENSEVIRECQSKLEFFLSGTMNISIDAGCC